MIAVDTRPVAGVLVRGAAAMVARHRGCSGGFAMAPPVVSLFVEPAFAYLVYSCCWSAWRALVQRWWCVCWAVVWAAWRKVRARRDAGK